MAQIPPRLKNKRKFVIAPWLGENEGEKVILYGDTGIGKTTLAALAKNSVFIGIDDGGRKIKHPITGKDLNHVKGISDFSDVRNTLTQSHLFDNVDTIIIDNITELERWGLEYLLKTVPKNQQGTTVKHIEDYGYHKGYRRWHDIMRLILQDCDPLIRAGKNIIMIAQRTIAKDAHAEIEDFVREGPELHHDKNVSTLQAYVSWADHVFRIALTDVSVKAGKAKGSSTRGIFTRHNPCYYAKSRTLPESCAVVSFESPTDDSIWKILFEGARP